MRLPAEIEIDLDLGRLGILLLVGILVLFAMAENTQAMPVSVLQMSASSVRGWYYLTQSDYYGDQALTACASGYHMATLWEILDPSNLIYDTTRGYQHTTGDHGYGPPSAVEGWVRTGSPSGVGPGAGNSNCAVWTSNSGQATGTVVSLPTDWAMPTSTMSVWVVDDPTCNLHKKVWCYQPPAVLYLPMICR